EQRQRCGRNLSVSSRANPGFQSPEKLVAVGRGRQSACSGSQRNQTGGVLGYMKLLSRMLLVLCITCCLSACGYHVAGHSSTLPATIHTIAIPALENKTTTYRIEQKLTAATIHEFLAKTRYRVVSDPNGGDAVLRGKVLSVEIVPLTFETT